MKITTLFLRLVIYAALLASIYFIIAYGAAQGFQDESSVIEVAQEVLLVLMIGISFYCAKRYVSYHRLNVLLGAIALVSLIREFNNFLNEYLFAHAWTVLVFAALIPTAYYCWRNYRGLHRDIEEVAGSYAFGIVLSGGLVLHVFSRLYGLNTLWMDVMGNDYQRVFARISEESIELLAYTMVFVGICEIALLTVSASSKELRRRKDAVLPAGAKTSLSNNEALHS